MLKETHNFFSIAFAIAWSIIVLAVSLFNVMVFHTIFSNEVMNLALVTSFVLGFNYVLEVQSTYVRAKFRFATITFFTKKINRDNITKCYMEKVRPFLQFGGWGYRWGMKGKGFIFPTSNRTLVVQTKYKGNYYFSMYEPEKALKILCSNNNDED